MITVEKLTASRRVQGRYYALFDSGETLKVTDALILQFALAPERELSDEEFAELRECAVEEGAKSRALHILGAKMCSSGQLKRRLVELGETPDTADEVCDWCIEMGLIDDAEYARQVAESYSSRGYGAMKIRDELYRRRVPRDYWDDALECAGDESDAAERALELIEKKLRGETPDRDDRRKIGASLARRGFSWDEINAAFSLYAENADFGDDAFDD